MEKIRRILNKRSANKDELLSNFGPRSDDIFYEIRRLPLDLITLLLSYLSIRTQNLIFRTNKFWNRFSYNENLWRMNTQNIFPEAQFKETWKDTFKKAYEAFWVLDSELKKFIAMSNRNLTLASGPSISLQLSQHSHVTVLCKKVFFLGQTLLGDQRR